MRITLSLILILQTGILTANIARAEDIMFAEKNAGLPVQSLSLLNTKDNKPAQGMIRPEFYTPYDIVEIYLAAVGKGELVILNQVVNKSMLIPVRVEYVYEIASHKTSRKVFSKLKNLLNVPGHDCCQINGIGAILDEKGHIVETEIHLIAKK